MSPQDPNILPMQIGIAPAPREIHVSAGASAEVIADRLAFAARNEASEVKLSDTRRPPRAERPARTFNDEAIVGMDQPALRVHPAGPSMLVGANGLPISATPAPAELVGVTGETLNSLTWTTYLAWRKTKCRPFDYTNGPSLATEVDSSGLLGDSELNKARALEEIDQATLEFIGEVAELGELFAENGPTTFYGNLREKLIDECGDIFFTGAWALDAWGVNPLYGQDDLEFLRVDEESNLPVFTEALASNQLHVIMGNPRFITMLGGLVWNFLLTAQTNAGLTANSFKKLRYQRREQDAAKQAARVGLVFAAVNQILIIANSSVEEALKSNMRKLDARFPEGYKPGVGGGIRTGAGA